MGEADAHPADFNAASAAPAPIAYSDRRVPEGRPLSLLAGGGGIAAISLLLIVVLAYRTWYGHQLDVNYAYAGISFLFAFYVFGVYLFCYGYEMYDVPRALRLTMIIAAISIVAIFALIAALFLLSRMKGGAGKAASVAADSSTDDESSPLPVRSLFGALGSMVSDRYDADHRQMQDSPSDDGANRVFLITCRNCGQRFTPEPPVAACTYCGQAALPS